MNPLAAHVRIGPFDFDTVAGELRSAGRTIRLPDQSFQVLRMLAERPGELVTREELRERLWTADTFVDFDAGLNNAVNKLRDALDSPGHPRCIETVPRRGYRLVARVEPTRRRRGVVFRYAIAAVILFAAGILLSVSRTRAFIAQTMEFGRPPAIRSLVVLPFENLIGDPAQEYLVDGISAGLTTDLAQLRTLRVISRTSAAQYKHAAKRLTDIARELDVDGVVEGSVSRTGDRVIVRAQLIQARGDRHLWAQTYQREQRNLVALQADIALAIAREIDQQIRPDEAQRLSRVRMVSPQAYDEYLRGRFEWNRRTPAGTLSAVHHFEAAIAADPQYAPAHSGLSDAYRFFDAQGLAAPAEGMPKAEAAGRRALALDDSLAEAHASLAGVLYRYRWEWQASEQEFQRALSLDRNNAEIHRAYAGLLFTLRRYAEAVDQGYRARALDPLSPVISVELASALFRAHRPDEARAVLEHARTLTPTGTRVDQALAFEHLDRRRWRDAIDVIRRSTSGEAPSAWLAYAYAMDGRPEDARAVLARLHALAATRFVWPQMFAVVHFGLGEREEGFRWLDEACRQRAFEMRTFTSGLFDLLADDPRFQDLLRRMGLSQFPEFALPAGAARAGGAGQSAARVR
jgi:TolB-like protein/DNA-binding winged helix-turn-helix (wHTH) protein/Tfp pilus assembly protein PilF